MVNSMAPSGTLIRKDCFEKIGYFNEDQSIRGLEDKEMWLRLASRFQGGMVYCSLFRYREHPAQQSRKVTQMIAGERKVLQSFFMKNPHHSRLYRLAKANFFYTSALLLRDNGRDHGRAIFYF